MQGEPGLLGAPGPMGSKGEIGLPGPRGDVGDAGQPGSQGVGGMINLNVLLHDFIVNPWSKALHGEGSTVLQENILCHSELPSQDFPLLGREISWSDRIKLRFLLLRKKDYFRPNNQDQH